MKTTTLILSICSSAKTKEPKRHHTKEERMKGMISSRVSRLLGVSFTVGIAFVAVAAWTQVMSIPNPDPVAEDRFGFAMLLTDNALVIAADGTAVGGNPNGGAIHVFDAETLEPLFALHNPSPEVVSSFGASLAKVGGKLVVGADGFADAGGTGAVFVFKLESGQLEFAIPNPRPGTRFIGGPPAGSFGFAVTNARGRILVGAPENVYLFDPKNGDLLLHVRNPSPEIDDFGFAVAALKERLVVAAPAHDPSGVPDAGTVYVLDGATGGTILTIPNPDPDPGDRFGNSVAVVGGNILVGAFRDDSAGPDAGAVYLFDGSTGALLLELLNPEPEDDEPVGTSAAQKRDQFGHVVGQVAGYIAVGVPVDDPGGLVNRGTVYLFHRRSGNLVFRLAHPNPAMGAAFGRSFVADGRILFVGAPLDDLPGLVDAGAAYVLRSLIQQEKDEEEDD